MTKRPSGITIIAGLQIFGAIVALLLLIILFPDYTFFKDTLVNELYTVYLTIMVVMSLIVAYGLLKGMKWAWSVTILFQIISMVSNTINLNIFALAVGLLIIYYITRPHVKIYFEKTHIKD